MKTATCLFLSLAVCCSAEFNVTQFGAVAGGVTDSAPGIQSAIDAAAKAGGGTVVLPPSAMPYLVRGGVAIRHSGIELSGRGARLLLADGAINGSVTPMIQFTGTEQQPIRNVVLRGLTVDANYFNQVSARNSKAIVFRFAEDAAIEDVAITRPYVGLSIRRSVGVEARRVTVTDYREDGFDTGGEADEVPGGKTKRISFNEVVARDAPRCARDGNAFEIEDGAEGVLIQDAIIEGVAGNGVGLRNHSSENNHSRDIELRNVTVRRIGGAFAVFATSARRERSVSNSYQEVRLVNVTAEAPVAFWGPVRKLRLTGGRFTDIYLGFDSLTGPATAANALADACLKDLQAGAIRINGASDEIELFRVSAKSIQEVRAR